MNSTYEGPDNTDYLITTVIVGTFYSLIVVLPSNVYVVWLILGGAKLAPDFFYLNLSVTEILFSLSTIWFFGFYLSECYSCLKVYVFSHGLFFTARPLFQCCICIECYLGVNCPVLFLRLKPLRYRVACCSAAWLLIMMSCIYYMHTFTEILHLFTFFTQNILLFFTMLFCLLSVLWTLKRPGPGENNTEKKSSRTKIKAFKIILITISTMAVNFLLFVVPIPLQFCMSEMTFLNAFTICTCLTLITGCIQPLIYLRRADRIPCLREL